MLGPHPLLRDLFSPRAGKDRATDAYRPPAITDPRRDIDAVEMYVPFSWYEPMRLENSASPRRARAPDGPAGHVRGRTAAKIALARPVRRSDRSLG